MTLSATIKSTPARWMAWISRLTTAATAQGVRTGIIVTFIAVAAVSLSVVSAPGVAGVLGGGLALIMLAIAVIDQRSFIIPDALNAAGFWLGLIHSLVQQPDEIVWAGVQAMMRGAALALLFLSIRYVYARLRGRQGLGLGDVKLAAVAGAWLEWPWMPVAIEIAALAALSVCARQLLLGRPIAATSRLPFGLFFAPAIWMCWLLTTGLLSQY